MGPYRRTLLDPYLCKYLNSQAEALIVCISLNTLKLVFDVELIGKVLLSTTECIYHKPNLSEL